MRNDTSYNPHPSRRPSFLERLGARLASRTSLPATHPLAARFLAWAFPTLALLAVLVACGLLYSCATGTCIAYAEELTPAVPIEEPAPVEEPDPAAPVEPAEEPTDVPAEEPTEEPGEVPTGAPSFDFDGSYLSIDSMIGEGDTARARLWVDVSAMTMCVRIDYYQPADYAEGSPFLRFDCDESEFLHAGALLGSYCDGTGTRWAVYELAKPTGWLPEGWEPEASWVSSYEVGTTLAGGKSAAVGNGLHGPGVPTFGVAHEFVSGTEGKELPEEIDPGMLPPTRLGIEVGTTVYPGADSFDPVEVEGGTWRFVGWDAGSAVIADPGVIFTGTWVF